MASDVEDVCTNYPDFAVICSFIENFGEKIKLTLPNISELQCLLEDNDAVNPLLAQCIGQLLRRIYKNVKYDKWEKGLQRFAHSYSPVDAWELERCGFKKAKLEVKLRVLKNLLESQFDHYKSFKEKVNLVKTHDLRLLPCGRDKNGVSYWCQIDDWANLRVYKDDQDEETWTLVAKTKEELLALIEDLETKTYSKPGGDASVEESRSGTVTPMVLSQAPTPTPSGRTSPSLENYSQESMEPLNESTSVVDGSVAEENESQISKIVKEEVKEAKPKVKEKSTPTSQNIAINKTIENKSNTESAAPSDSVVTSSLGKNAESTCKLKEDLSVPTMKQVSEEPLPLQESREAKISSVLKELKESSALKSGKINAKSVTKSKKVESLDDSKSDNKDCKLSVEAFTAIENKLKAMEGYSSTIPSTEVENTTIPSPTKLEILEKPNEPFSQTKSITTTKKNNGSALPAEKLGSNKMDSFSNENVRAVEESNKGDGIPTDNLQSIQRFVDNFNNQPDQLKTSQKLEEVVGISESLHKRIEVERLSYNTGKQEKNLQSSFSSADSKSKNIANEPVKVSEKGDNANGKELPKSISNICPSKPSIVQSSPLSKPFENSAAFLINKKKSLIGKKHGVLGSDNENTKSLSEKIEQLKAGKLKEYMNKEQQSLTLKSDQNKPSKHSKNEYSVKSNMEVSQNLLEKPSENLNLKKPTEVQLENKPVPSNSKQVVGGRTNTSTENPLNMTKATNNPVIDTDAIKMHSENKEPDNQHQHLDEPQNLSFKPPISDGNLSKDSRVLPKDEGKDASPSKEVSELKLKSVLKDVSLVTKSQDEKVLKVNVKTSEGKSFEKTVHSGNDSINEDFSTGVTSHFEKKKLESHIISNIIKEDKSNKLYRNESSSVENVVKKTVSKDNTSSSKKNASENFEQKLKPTNDNSSNLKKDMQESLGKKTVSEENSSVSCSVLKNKPVESHNFTKVTELIKANAVSTTPSYLEGKPSNTDSLTPVLQPNKRALEDKEFETFQPSKICKKDSEILEKKKPLDNKISPEDSPLVSKDKDKRILKERGEISMTATEKTDQIKLEIQDQKSKEGAQDNRASIISFKKRKLDILCSNLEASNKKGKLDLLVEAKLSTELHKLKGENQNFEKNSAQKEEKELTDEEKLPLNIGCKEGKIEVTDLSEKSKGNMEVTNLCIKSKEEKVKLTESNKEKEEVSELSAKSIDLGKKSKEENSEITDSDKKLKEKKSNVTDLNAKSQKQTTVTDLSTKLKVDKPESTGLVTKLDEKKTEATDLSMNIKEGNPKATDQIAKSKEDKPGMTDLSAKSKDDIPEMTDLRTRSKVEKAKVTELITKSKENNQETDFGTKLKEEKTKVTQYSSNSKQEKTEVTNLSSKSTEDKLKMTDLSENSKEEKSNTTDLIAKSKEANPEEKVEVTDLITKSKENKPEMADLCTKFKEEKSVVTQLSMKSNEEKPEVTNLSIKSKEDKLEIADLSTKSKEEDPNATDLITKSKEDEPKATDFIEKSREDKPEMTHFCIESKDEEKGVNDLSIESKEGERVTDLIAKSGDKSDMTNLITKVEVTTLSDKYKPEVTDLSLKSKNDKPEGTDLSTKSKEDKSDMTDLSANSRENPVVTEINKKSKEENPDVTDLSSKSELEKTKATDLNIQVKEKKTQLADLNTRQDKRNAKNLEQMSDKNEVTTLTEADANEKEDKSVESISIPKLDEESNISKCEKSGPTKSDIDEDKPITEPVLIVKGDGDGSLCQSGNMYEEMGKPWWENFSEDFSTPVGEVIVEEIKYFCGDGAGADCEAGNSGDEADSQSEAIADKNKPFNLSVNEKITQESDKLKPNLENKNDDSIKSVQESDKLKNRNENLKTAQKSDDLKNTEVAEESCNLKSEKDSGKINGLKNEGKIDKEDNIQEENKSFEKINSDVISEEDKPKILKSDDKLFKEKVNGGILESSQNDLTNKNDEITPEEPRDPLSLDFEEPAIKEKQDMDSQKIKVKGRSRSKREKKHTKALVPDEEDCNSRIDEDSTSDDIALVELQRAENRRRGSRTPAKPVTEVTRQRSARIAKIREREETERRELEAQRLAQIAEENKIRELHKKARDERRMVREIKKGHKEKKEKKDKKKKKKKKRAKKKIKSSSDPWAHSSTSSSSSSEELEIEMEEDSAEELVFKSDHEFSPESDIGEEDAQPIKRARTAKKKIVSAAISETEIVLKEEEEKEEVEEDDEEMDTFDNTICTKCNHQDHPETILLCDVCDKGWHLACLRPPLFSVPEGDWICPKCEHTSLIEKLKEFVEQYETVRKKAETEELRKERLAYINISLDNVITTKKIKKDSGSASESDSENSESESDGSSSSSLGSSSESSSPLYTLRARPTRTLKEQVEDFDELINEAIKDELEAAKAMKSVSRGKDIANIMEGETEDPMEVEEADESPNDDTAEEEKKPFHDDKKDIKESADEIIANEDKVFTEEIKENVKLVEEVGESEDVGEEPVEEVQKKSKPIDDSEDEELSYEESFKRGSRMRKQPMAATKKKRRLTDLDFDEEDNDSDEDFMGASDEGDEESEDESEMISSSFTSESESDDSDVIGPKRRSNRYKNMPLRRSSRNRRNAPSDENDSDAAHRKRSKKKKKRKYFSSSEEEEEESSDSDSFYSRKKKKKKPAARSRSRTKSRSNKKAKKKTNRKAQNKRKTKEEDDENAPAKPKPRIRYSKPTKKPNEEAEEESVSRRRVTRGRQINFLDSFLLSDEEEEEEEKPKWRGKVMKGERRPSESSDYEASDDDKKKPKKKVAQSPPSPGIRRGKVMKSDDEYEEEDEELDDEEEEEEGEYDTPAESNKPPLRGKPDFAEKVVKKAVQSITTSVIAKKPVESNPKPLPKPATVAPVSTSSATSVVSEKKKIDTDNIPATSLKDQPPVPPTSQVETITKIKINPAPPLKTRPSYIRAPNPTPPRVPFPPVSRAEVHVASSPVRVPLLPSDSSVSITPVNYIPNPNVSGPIRHPTPLSVSKSPVTAPSRVPPLTSVASNLPQPFKPSATLEPITTTPQKPVPLVTDSRARPIALKKGSPGPHSPVGKWSSHISGSSSGGATPPHHPVSGSATPPRMGLGGPPINASPPPPYRSSPAPSPHNGGAPPPPHVSMAHRNTPPTTSSHPPGYPPYPPPPEHYVGHSSPFPPGGYHPPGTHSPGPPPRHAVPGILPPSHPIYGSAPPPHTAYPHHHPGSGVLRGPPHDIYPPNRHPGPPHPRGPIPTPHPVISKGYPGLEPLPYTSSPPGPPEGGRPNPSSLESTKEDSPVTKSSESEFSSGLMSYFSSQREEDNVE